MDLKTAKCQRTGREINISDGFLVASAETGEWEFASGDAAEIYGDYNVPVRKLVGSPAALVDWLAHLNEKSWFDPKKFLDFFTRFRQENNLYNSI